MVLQLWNKVVYRVYSIEIEKIPLESALVWGQRPKVWELNKGGGVKLDSSDFTRLL